MEGGVKNCAGDRELSSSGKEPTPEGRAEVAGGAGAERLCSCPVGPGALWRGLPSGRATGPGGGVSLPRAHAPGKAPRLRSTQHVPPCGAYEGGRGRHLHSRRSWLQKVGQRGVGVAEFRIEQVGVPRPEQGPCGGCEAGRETLACRGGVCVCVSVALVEPWLRRR